MQSSFLLQEALNEALSIPGALLLLESVQCGVPINTELLGLSRASILPKVYLWSSCCIYDHL